MLYSPIPCILYVDHVSCMFNFNLNSNYMWKIKVAEENV